MGAVTGMDIRGTGFWGLGPSAVVSVDWGWAGPGRAGNRRLFWKGTLGAALVSRRGNVSCSGNGCACCHLCPVPVGGVTLGAGWDVNLGGRVKRRGFSAESVGVGRALEGPARRWSI